MKKVILPLYFLIILFLASCESTEPAPDSSRDGGILSYSSTGGGGVPTGDPDDPSDEPKNDPPPAGQITAGEWRDLDHWDFWLGLGQNEELLASQETWGFHTLSRYQVQVADKLDRPLIDAVVRLYDTSDEVLWQSHTDNRGFAELWNGALSAGQVAGSIRVTYNGQEVKVDSPSPYMEGINSVKMNVLQQCPDLIDLMFVVDATGSMSDELEYLKSELNDVISGIEPSAHVRLGSVFYRDEEDEYLTRTFPFTTNIQDMIADISDQKADGGGDYPEAVHTALDEAINHMNWSDNATTRLLFLLLDAPPHENSQVETNIRSLVDQASHKGIRIIPISASGIDKSTEFLLRSMAQLTQGTYVFVTNDSGIGDDHLIPTVGDYEVELLNELLVRLINDYGAFCYSNL